MLLSISNISLFHNVPSNLFLPLVPKKAPDMVLRTGNISFFSVFPLNSPVTVVHYKAVHFSGVLDEAYFGR